LGTLKKETKFFCRFKINLDENLVIEEKSLVDEKEKKLEITKEREKSLEQKKKNNETQKVLRIKAGRFTCDKVDFLLSPLNQTSIKHEESLETH